MKRGEIWLTTLDPTVGGEIQKTRPCLIVSPDEMNTGLRTCILVPMTTGNRPAPFRVPVRFRGKDGLLLAEQARAVSRERLIVRLGKVEARALREVLAVLQEMFAD